MNGIFAKFCLRYQYILRLSKSDLARTGVFLSRLAGCALRSLSQVRCTFASPGKELRRGAACLLITASVVVPSAVAEEASGGVSVADTAKELLKPNTSLASLTLRSQYWRYEWDLPSADSQDNATFVFQPVFPIDLGRTEADDAPRKFFD